MIASAGISDRPTFCIAARDASAFDRFAPVIQALCERHERFGLILMARDAVTRDRLAQVYRLATVLAPPGGGKRFAKRLKLKCFIALGGLEHADRRFLATLKRRAVPLVVIAMPGCAIVPSEADHYIVGEDAGVPRLRAAGADGEQVSVVGGLAAPGPIGPQATARIVDILTPFLARHAALARSRQQRPWHRLEAFLLRWLTLSRIRRLESVGELRRALGEPRSILCLGNGPSSEDPALLTLSYDRLFRVNHRWLERGLLAQPDMVFTGSKKTLVAVRGSIFGLSSIEIEMMLLRKWLPYSPFRRLTYFTPERSAVAGAGARPAQAFQPTNGVIMLATAVALEPRSLIVAGIDLFQDRRGAYPGDVQTANAYAAAHDRDAELRMMTDILGRFRGELVIIGDVLREHWDEHRRGRAGVTV